MEILDLSKMPIVNFIDDDGSSYVLLDQYHYSPDCYKLPEKDLLEKIFNDIKITLDNYDLLKERLIVLNLEAKKLIKENNIPFKKVINSKKSIGYVYVMECKRVGYFKIGYTNNISSRLKQLKTANPTIQITYYQKVNNMFELETFLHERFKNKKVKGEWFDLTNAEIVDIIDFLDKNKVK
jgi:predicted GIY-YIG superfamily endonuclease